MIERAPIRTPGQTVTPAPSQQSSPIVIGRARFDGFAALFEVYRMLRRADTAAGADERVVADRDAAAVEKRAAGVDKDAFAQLNPMTVVAVERRHDPGSGMAMGD